MTVSFALLLLLPMLPTSIVIPHHEGGILQLEGFARLSINSPLRNR